MTIKATFSQIKNRRNFVLGVNYCQLQRTLSLLGYEADLYNATAYGWACDFYPITSEIGVVTGYVYNQACDVPACNLVPIFRDKLHSIEQKVRKIDVLDNKAKARLKTIFENLLDQARRGVYNKGDFAYITIEQRAGKSGKGAYKIIVKDKKIKMRSTFKLMDYCNNFAKKYAEKHSLFYDWDVLRVKIVDDKGNFIYKK